MASSSAERMNGECGRSSPTRSRRTASCEAIRTSSRRWYSRFGYLTHLHPHRRPMQRRDFLKAFGASTALALLPHESAAAWARVAAGWRPPGGLTDAQLALIAAVADTIIPRTDSPSASDVGVS